MLKWVFPNIFFLFNIQSMRSTACVKVQIIWTCTSRWSGSITSTARTCQLFKSMYLNIQREYLRTGILPCSPLWPRDWCHLCSLFGLQLVWAICHHVVGWEWRSLQRFSTWSPGEGQKRRGNCFLSAFFTKCWRNAIILHPIKTCGGKNKNIFQNKVILLMNNVRFLQQNVPD